MWLTISCRRSIIKCICLPLLAVINTLLEYIIILPELFDLFSLSTKFISDETFSYTIVLLLSNHLLNRNDISLLYWCCNKCRYICKKAPAVIRQGLNQLNLYQLRHTIICVPCNGRITVLTYFLNIGSILLLYLRVPQGCLEVIFNYALLTPASTIPARYRFLS